MKKIWSLVISLLLFLPLACVTDDDDENKPSGNGTLELTVNYDNASSTIQFGESTGTTLGSELIYAYLFDTRPTTSRSTHLYSGSTATNGGTITITDIAPGDYFILVFYDYFGSANATPPDNPDNQNDLYELYDDTPCQPDADTFTILEGTNTLSITFDDSWNLGNGGAFDVCI